VWQYVAVCGSELQCIAGLFCQDLQCGAEARGDHLSGR